MDWLLAAWVGVAGGATMEAIDVIKSVRWHGSVPWEVQPETIEPPRRRRNVRPGEEQLPAPGRQGYCLATALRLFVSGAPTGVLAATYPHTVNPLVAYMVGLGALSVVQQLATLVPLAVKSVGQAALGSVAGEAQQDVVASQAQHPNGHGHGHVDDVPVRPPTEASPVHGVLPDTGVPAPQAPSDGGGSYDASC
ncbi:hypothetical protein P2Q00_49775 [Streptomyces coacervatus]|uniref:hypothetical protein n=1 Tax=Streptomyces coacervatus TaxID=647381 RepID=UPI0023DCDCEC|nr:hypothetical protein [Streptomyces coacervatus]MDF2273423.1 hypothetical protein [Streptomyces coacervatus]